MKNLYLSTSAIWIVAATSAAAQMPSTVAPTSSSSSPPGQLPTVAQPSGDQGGVAASDSSQITDIVVTAQKRRETAQSVPIAITAIGGEALQQAHVVDTQSLQLVVPSLNYGNDSGFATPFLRGVGSTVQAPGSEASVATFVDGVYIASSQGQISNLLGVDRVEVLAGPQGTLYGRNASGGAINIYSLTPREKLEAGATLGYGNYNRFEGSAHVSGGLTDRLAVGLYVAGTRRDTFIDFEDPKPDGQRTHNQSWGVRGKFVWNPVDAIKLTGSLEHTYEYNVENGVRNVQPNAIGITLGASPTIQPYVYSEDVPQFTRTKTTFAALREEADLGFAQVLGVTGYRNLNSFTQTNLDGTNAPVAYVFSPVHSKQFSQEVQLLSNESSKIKWIVGAYYFHEKSGFLPLSVRSAVLLPAPLVGYDFFAPIKTRSYAIFGQTTIPLVGSLGLTLGGRYTWDRKVKGDSHQDLLGPDGIAVTIPSSGAAKSWSKFTPKVSLDYKWHDVLLYASYSEGYKSGLFTTSSADNTPVNPEVLKAFEVGLKSDLLNRRLRVNISTYHYSFNNLQVSVFTGGAAQIYENAATARAYGVEATVSAKPTATTTLRFGASFEKSDYSSYENAPFYILSPLGNENSSVSAKGNPLIRAPKFVGTAAIDQRIPLGNGSEVLLSGDVYHNSGFNWDPAGQRRQEEFNLVNGSITYTPARGRWKASFWAKNVFNKYHSDISTITNFGTYLIDAEPRTYGGTLSWNL